MKSPDFYVDYDIFKSLGSDREGMNRHKRYNEKMPSVSMRMHPSKLSYLDRKRGEKTRGEFVIDLLDRERAQEEAREQRREEDLIKRAQEEASRRMRPMPQLSVPLPAEKARYDWVGALWLSLVTVGFFGMCILLYVSMNI